MQNNIIAKFNLEDGREVIFRYPQIKDAQIMADYINTLSKEHTFISFQGEEVSLEYEQKRLNKLLHQINEKEAIQLLAFYNSQLIGISDIIMRERAEKHVGSFGITIAKDFRGAGVGKKLMQTIIDEAIVKLPQLKILVLGVFNDNPIAQNMYMKMGFIEYGSLPQGLMHQGHLDNHIYMYKKVRNL